MQEGTFSIPANREVTTPPAYDVFAAQCPTRQLLDRVADKWSVLILTTLGAQEMRFNALRRHIEGISQKMLSQTLRALERDGLVERSVVASIPVKVSYALTPLGAELLEALRAMIAWAEQRMDDVAKAQARFDRAHAEAG
ncbi:helix-turn-helix transcriptional regulator [Novosphingobium sp. YJ-S2-02]|uniref:Helix-turn-helix transcriptional regulator n=1 Tax=Novosphingobium aureum TaxID=2792964 RepID=A0A931HCG4_9SPHN|nr:helix-turn-helix domain-containing protein [Novosphingobium aureum]MBH0112933.1 helix-turn-helix transcriptional regulator [Novosphingobium aureum]